MSAALLSCAAYDCVALVFEIIYEVPAACGATLDGEKKEISEISLRAAFFQPLQRQSHSEGPLNAWLVNRRERED